MAKKNIPKRDGSGKGVRANRGRSGCITTRSIGKRRDKKRRYKNGFRRSIL